VIKKSFAMKSFSILSTENNFVKLSKELYRMFKLIAKMKN